MRPDLHEQNRRSWNHATVAHNRHKGDQAAFLRDGGTTLFPEEVELLQPARGRRVVHLQCNAGQDTLSIAQLGAVVTGVDISDEAIEFARRLAADSGISATFVRSDVYDWLASTEERFDVAFASYGALCWLSDLRTWARGVARVLAPGGRLVVMEFHPALYLVDERDGQIVWGPSRGAGGAHIAWDDGVLDYVQASAGGLGPDRSAAIVDEPFVNPEACHEFEWSVCDVIDAVASAGLRVERAREWPYSNGCRFFPSMIDLGGRRWGMPPGAPPIPLMYAMVARAAG